MTILWLRSKVAAPKPPQRVGASNILSFPTIYAIYGYGYLVEKIPIPFLAPSYPGRLSIIMFKKHDFNHHRSLVSSFNSMR